jgi:hypothetical protein
MAINPGNYLKAALLGVVAGILIIAVLAIKFLIMELLFNTYSPSLNDVRSILNIIGTIVTMALPLLTGVVLVALIRKSSQLAEILKASAISGAIIGVLYFISSVLLYDVIYYILNPRSTFIIQDIIFSGLYDILYIIDLTGMTMLGAFIASLILKPGAGIIQATT